MMSDRNGATLVEVLVALTILFVIGSSALSNVAQMVGVAQSLRNQEAEVRGAGKLLDAVYLWSREDLDRRLGDREQGAYRLVIGRPFPELYTIVVRDTLGLDLLRTALYRPRDW